MIRTTGFRTGPVGLGGFTIPGLLHAKTRVGDYDFGFYGSAILSLTAIFAFGWFYSRKAQLFGVAVAVGFLVIEHWEYLYEVAMAQEDMTVEEAIEIITQV